VGGVLWACRGRAVGGDEVQISPGGVVEASSCAYSVCATNASQAGVSRLSIVIRIFSDFDLLVAVDLEVMPSLFTGIFRDKMVVGCSLKCLKSA
jgi:hypothetical protein